MALSILQLMKNEHFQNNESNEGNQLLRTSCSSQKSSSVIIEINEHVRKATIAVKQTYVAH